MSASFNITSKGFPFIKAEYTATDTFPVSQLLTGTFDQAAGDTILVGDSTSFSYSENLAYDDVIGVGDCIYAESLGEVRVVKSVDPVLQQIEIELPFSTALSGENLRVARGPIEFGVGIRCVTGTIDINTVDNESHTIVSTDPKYNLAPRNGKIAPFVVVVVDTNKAEITNAEYAA